MSKTTLLFDLLGAMSQGAQMAESRNIIPTAEQAARLHEITEDAKPFFGNNSRKVVPDSLIKKIEEYLGDYVQPLMPAATR